VNDSLNGWRGVLIAASFLVLLFMGVTDKPKDARIGWFLLTVAFSTALWNLYIVGRYVHAW
jgi:hypothetical protein